MKVVRNYYLMGKWRVKVWELIKIELLKNKYGKKKYILILSSLVMVIIPYIYIMFSREILDKINTPTEIGIIKL